MDLTSTVLGVLVPLILHFAHMTEGRERKLNDLYWQVPLGAFGTLFVVRLAVAPYWIFREEQQKRKQAEVERDALQKEVDDKKPRFSIELRSVVTGDLARDERGRVPFVLVTIFISNAGQPSVVHDWTVDFTPVDHAMKPKDAIRGKIEWIVEDMYLFEPMGAPIDFFAAEGICSERSRVHRIRKSEAIWEKAKTPIMTGGSVIGYVLAVFPQLDRQEIRKTGAKVQIGFRDVYGIQYSASATFAMPPYYLVLVPHAPDLK